MGEIRSITEKIQQELAKPAIKEQWEEAGTPILSFNEDVADK